MATFSFLPRIGPADIGIKENYSRPAPGQPHVLPGGGDDVFAPFEVKLKGSITVNAWSGGVLQSGTISAEFAGNVGTSGGGTILATTFNSDATANGGTIQADTIEGSATATLSGTVTAGLIRGKVATKDQGTVTADEVTNLPPSVIFLPETFTGFDARGGKITIGNLHTKGKDDKGNGTAMTNFAVGGIVNVASYGVDSEEGSRSSLFVEEGGKVTVSGEMNFGTRFNDVTSVVVDGAGSSFTWSGPKTIGDAGVGNLEIKNKAHQQISGDVVVGAQARFGGFGSNIAVTGMGSQLEIFGALTLGDAGFGGLAVSGGAQAAVQNVIGGNQEGSRGSFGVGGTGSLLLITGTTIIGNAGRGSYESAADLSVTTGAKLDARGAVTFGAQKTGFGGMRVSDPSTVFTISGGLTTIAQAGEARLRVDQGALFDTSQGDVIIGDAAGSSGTLTVAGRSSFSSTFVAPGRIDVGALTVGKDGTGRFDLTTQSQADIGKVLTVGGQNSNVSVGSGATLRVQGDVIAGDKAGARGTIQVTGSDAALPATLLFGADIEIGKAGQGDLSIFAHGKVKPLNAGVAGDLTIGQGAPAQVRLNGDGAELHAGDVTVGGVLTGTAVLLAGRGKAVFSGGLTLAGDNSQVTVGHVGSIKVEGGPGALIGGIARPVAVGTLHIDPSGLVSGIGGISTVASVALYGTLEAKNAGFVGNQLEITGPVGGGGHARIVDGATLTIGQSFDESTKAVFSGNGSRLKLLAAQSFEGLIVGFDGNDTIELANRTVTRSPELVSPAITGVTPGGAKHYYDPIAEVLLDGVAHLFRFLGHYVDPVFVALQIGPNVELRLVAGQASAPSLTTAFADTFYPNGGGGLVEGGGGFDQVNFSLNGPAEGLYIDLLTGIAIVGGGRFNALASIEGAIGGAGSDSIVGSGAANLLAGGGETDFLFGGGFNANGSFMAGTGNDTLDGNDGADALFGMDGGDLLRGGDGLDGLVGGAGNDTLEGGDGTDFLFGGDFAANGSFLPNSGNDVLKGGSSGDGLWGFDGNDSIDGEAGDDYVEGGLGDDAILGGAGGDTILAQAGNDTLQGGADFDYLYGGAGADTFSFRRGDSYDTAWDFSAAAGDRLRLDPATGVTNFPQFQGLLTGFSFDAGDGRGLVAYTVLNVAALGSNDQITVGGIAHTAWTAALVEFA